MYSTIGTELYLALLVFENSLKFWLKNGELFFVDKEEGIVGGNGGILFALLFRNYWLTLNV